MKVWLDDVRPMPEQFDVHAKTAWEAIELIDNNKVTVISLDHDLGDQEKCGSGYNVACHIEQRAVEGKEVPVWFLHTSNPVGRENMRRCLQSAERLYIETKEHMDSLV